MSAPGRPERVRLAVFAKAPVAGAVKTRLAASLGAEAAAALHARLVRHALGTALAAGIGRVELWCAPDANHPFFATCAAELGIALHAQRGADLGARMHHAFEHAAAHGDALVVIGSDCPVLPAEMLREAARRVRGGEAVFAPAEDGGYVLVGLAHPEPRLFDDIAWGTASVMEATRARLAETGLAWKELATLWDVDRPEDVARLERCGWPFAAAR
jgi:rSAM/selenodomain-associated transferase 1